jgi:hypothetical protein
MFVGSAHLVGRHLRLDSLWHHRYKHLVWSSSRRRKNFCISVIGDCGISIDVRYGKFCEKQNLRGSVEDDVAGRQSTKMIEPGDGTCIQFNPLKVNFENHFEKDVT